MTDVAIPPGFLSLGEEEQRAVAERLMRLEESTWRPFWCPDSECSGDPHWLLDENGDCTFVAESDMSGPDGEPVGEMHYESPDGEWFVTTGIDAEVPDTDDVPVGRPVLDPVWAHNHARVDQRLPGWLKPWTLFIMSGRGTGKTTTGVEFVTLCARKGLDGAILGRRGTELVNTHVAEIIARAHPEFVPTHWASKDILEWPEVTLPDGTKRKPITYLFSAEKPENIRSVNLSYAWVDEAAFMDEIETAWMNLKLATRVKRPGNPIHFLITSTPTGTPWVMKMEEDPDVIVRRVSTYANRANLDPGFIADLQKEYEGTRMGRQEIYGEVLRDVEGALWNDDMFIHEHIKDASDFANYIESLDDVVVGVDPAGSKSKRSDATGIIAAGARHFDDVGNRLASSTFDVIGRATVKGSVSEWARAVFRLANHVHARRIVVEKNFGGDMAKQVLLDYAKLNPTEAQNDWGEDMADIIKVTHAVVGKETRAEPVVGKYEQGRVTHVTSPGVFGDLSELEKQQVTWVPKSRGGRMPSPNDIDACVWAIRELETTLKFEAVGAMANQTRGKVRKPLGSGISAVSGNTPQTMPVTQKKVKIPLGGRKIRKFEIRRPT